MFCIRPLTRAITCAILVSTAFADVVTLKSGEKIEGKVTRENDQQVTMEIKVSAGITDERVIPRAEVDRIDKTSPEAEAYKAISVIQLGNNSMSAGQYDAPIRTLEAYLKQFPESIQAKNVQATLAEFQKEKKRVEAGEAKLRGQWLNKDEVEREKVQIAGSLAFEYMKNLAAAGDNIGALNAFLLVEKNYPGCASMPDIIDYAKQLIASIQPAVDRAIPEQKLLKAQKEKGFAESGPAERAEMIAAYKSEMAQAEATAAAAVAAGQWPPFLRTNEKALAALQAQVSKESKRLALLPVDKMRQSIQLSGSAKNSIAAANWDDAAASLKQATSLWAANEQAIRLGKELTAKKAAATVTAPVATPAPETPKPKGPATPKPSAAIKAAAATPAPAAEESSFFLSLPGAITIVVVIAASLIGVNVYKKAKAKKDAVAE